VVTLKKKKIFFLFSDAGPYAKGPNPNPDSGLFAADYECGINGANFMQII
jgi:hypothetical protein